MTENSQTSRGNVQEYPDPLALREGFAHYPRIPAEDSLSQLALGDIKLPDEEAKLEDRIRFEDRMNKIATYKVLRSPQGPSQQVRIGGIFHYMQTHYKREAVWNPLLSFKNDIPVEWKEQAIVTFLDASYHLSNQSIMGLIERKDEWLTTGMFYLPPRVHGRLWAAYFIAASLTTIESKQRETMEMWQDLMVCQRLPPPCFFFEEEENYYLTALNVDPEDLAPDTVKKFEGYSRAFLRITDGLISTVEEIKFIMRIVQLNIHYLDRLIMQRELEITLK